MADPRFKYRKRKHWKYRLKEDMSYSSGIEVQNDISIPKFIELETDGNLTVKAGYLWDGPSGPAIDTNTFMRASLFHDAIYQLIREGCLKRKPRRKEADILMRKICKEDKMNPVRRWYAYWFVRTFGRWSTSRVAPGVSHCQNPQ